MFEVVQFTDPKHPPGQPIVEERLGVFEGEEDAIRLARSALDSYVESAGQDYVWWIVREEGSTLARWIADSRERQEYVLDLRSGTLVPVD